MFSALAPPHPKPVYEIREHCADLRLLVRAPDFLGLCAEAVRGLAAVLVAVPEAIRASEEVAVSVAGERDEWLLHDLLEEVLYRFARGKLLVRTCTVTRTPHGLEALLRGERADPLRHELAHEVKAITYHGLEIVQRQGGCEVELLLDI